MEVDQNEEPPIDVETYTSNFTGHGKIERLLFIAKKAVNTQLGLDALRLAADELRKGGNTARYLEVINRINGRLGDAYTADRDWVDETDRVAQRWLQSLEAKLSGYKTNLIKESIRMGHNELGNFHYAHGNLQEAFKAYVRTRDYCTTSKHIWSMCLSVIRVAIELNNFAHVSNYIQKAEQAPDVKAQTVVYAKLQCAAGLAALEAKKYKQAARKFTEVSAELSSHWNEVISPQEVALYGGLCGLAYFDRGELKRHIIDNVQFREYLELYPEVREMVHDFYGSKYASCLSQLERLQPVLNLDMHISSHLSTLCSSVRSKALVQYTAPFLSVKLATMAAAFNTDVQGLEKELSELIQESKVQARIDSGSKVLYARTANLRSATFAWAMRAGEEYLRNTRALLLRGSLLQHDLIQKSPQQRGRGPGAHGGGHGGGSSASYMPPGITLSDVY